MNHQNSITVAGAASDLNRLPCFTLARSNKNLFDYDKDTLSDVVIKVILSDFKKISFEVF